VLTHLTISRLAGLSLLLASGLATISWQGQAQQQEQKTEQQTTEITLPPDRDMLRLRVVAPREARVNQSFEGRIEVRNLSQQVVFHDVKIGQLAESGLTIESSKMGEAKSKQSKSKGTNEDSSKQQNDGKKQEDAQKQASNESASQQHGKFSQVWTIDRLDPGQSRTIHFTASSNEQGDAKSCLALVSMTPSLCLSTKFVKPELEIVKQGPEQVNLCEPIVYQYSVKNSGTGELESFTIYDELAEGLKTLEGKNELRFQVDGLRAGDVRKFSAKLVSTKSGDFKSRAAAKSKAGEEARSNSVTTRVVEPQLALAIEGPDAVYVDRPATYTVRVSNHGHGRADRAQVVLRFPQTLSVATVSEPWDSERSVEKQGQSHGQSQQDEKQPTKAKQENSKAKNTDRDDNRNRNENRSNQKDGRSENSSQGRDMAQWKLGELAAGETRAMRITLNTHRGGAVEMDAEALAWCGSGDDAQQIAKVSKSQRTEVISLPALALAVVDLEDPVQTDDKVTYRVTVRNEGTSGDSDIRVRITLPNQLQFEKATGPTKGQAEGNEVTFEPVKQLGAGEEVSWRLEAKAAQQGEVALRATLESKGLGKTVKAEEPTTLFTASAKNDSTKQ
jgi:uncharacterized repeat protein (TIGR01451 family)